MANSIDSGGVGNTDSYLILPAPAVSFWIKALITLGGSRKYARFTNFRGRLVQKHSELFLLFRPQIAAQWRREAEAIEVALLSKL